MVIQLQSPGMNTLCRIALHLHIPRGDLPAISHAQPLHLATHQGHLMPLLALAPL